MDDEHHQEEQEILGDQKKKKKNSYIYWALTMIYEHTASLPLLVPHCGTDLGRASGVEGIRGNFPEEVTLKGWEQLGS